MKQDNKTATVTAIYLLIGLLGFLPIVLLLEGFLSYPKVSEQLLAILIMMIYFSSYILLVVKETKAKILLIILTIIAIALFGAIEIFREHKLPNIIM